MTIKTISTSLRTVGLNTIIDIQGEINGLAEPELTRAYQEASASHTQTITLNFSEVDYINSTGIALIVGLLAQARKERKTLAVYGLSPHYREIFEITRLVDFMQVYEDEASALAI
jgi:anti-anti-sigma factor